MIFKKTRLNRRKICLFCLYFGTKKWVFFAYISGRTGGVGEYVVE